jgi:hypothetical protein
MSVQFRYSFLLFAFLFLFFANTAFANNKDTLSTFLKLDNVEKINNTFSFRPYYTIKSTSISIIDKNNVSEPVLYRAKIPSSAGLGFGYKFIYICLSLDLPRSSESIAKYGNTKSTSFQMSIQRRHFGMKFFFRNYRHFYLSNPTDFYEDWNSSRFPKRTDIGTYTLGFYNNYILSNRFSMNAAFDQSERQKKSGGSLMLMGGGFISHLVNDSTMIPYDVRDNFPDLRNYRKGTFNSVIIAPGYGYSFVQGNFSLTPVLFAGSGPQFQSNRETHKRYFRMRLPLFFSSKVALSYNAKTFFSCISFSYETSNVPFHLTKIRTGTTALEFAAGVRF